MTRDLLTPLWTAQRLPTLTARDWERLLSQARCARLSGRLARWCEEKGCLADVPIGPRRHLESALRQVRRLQDQTRWEADCLRRALGALPTPIVLLKGAAYVLADLPPARGRIFVDVDILVAREHLRDVEMALFAAGWVAQRLDPYDDRYYRDLMHELPPMQHVERGTALDVHHTLTPPTSRFAIEVAPILASVRPLPGQERLSTLAPADMVLHSAVHLMQDGEHTAALRDVLDIADLVRAFEVDPDFWPTLLARARELAFGEVLNDVLQQACRVAGLTLPPGTDEALRRMAPRTWRNRLMARLLCEAMRPMHPDCNGTLTALSRWMLYGRSHWLRMPWYQILPHLARKAWRRLKGARGAAPVAHPLGLRP